MSSSPIAAGSAPDIRPDAPHPGQPRGAGPADRSLPRGPAALACELLVIGYGNALFGDDGVGPRVAECVEDWCRPGVLARSVHQLTPELAADVAAAERVIFVDAAVRGERAECVSIVADESIEGALDHALTPGALLALSRLAFGRAPAATIILVPAEDFTLGHALSPCAQSGLERALALIAAQL